MTNQADAPIRVRMFSFATDLTVIAALQLTLGSLTLLLYQKGCARFDVTHNQETLLFLSEFCGGFFFLSYFTLSVGFFGNTLGKHIFKIKTVNAANGLSLTMPQAYWRSISYLMSSWTYMVGFVIPLFRSDKKALHDLLCGTQVVRQVQSEESNEPQLELPLFASVHPIKTQTTQVVHELAQTGTAH